MAEIIRMPRLSDTMEEGNIIGWQKKVGDAVKPRDILAEVETHKTTMELENFIEGTLLYIGVPEGAVPVDSVIAIIGKPGEDIKSMLAEVAAESAAPTSAPAAEIKPESPVAAPASTPVQSPAPVAAPIASSDFARRIGPQPFSKENALAERIRTITQNQKRNFYIFIRFQ